MTRIAIVVGCDTYDSEKIGTLTGAEVDARRIAEALRAGTDRVLLLLSPSAVDVQNIFASISKEPIEDLTFYFAGHGVVRSDRLFLCLRTTEPDSLAATSLPFQTLMILIQDCNPSHANIVIDACESGGVAGDISNSLSHRTIGAYGTFGLSLLAACTRDQSAMETDEGGVCTTALVNCIDGTTFVQDISDDLDLMEIAKHVAISVGNMVDQSPIYWGVNLTGAARFCANPRVSEDSPVRRAIANAPGIGTLSKEAKSELVRLHTKGSDDIDPAEVRDALILVREELKLAPEQAIQFSRQLATSLSLACRNHPDPFRPIEIRSACLAPLLEDCATVDAVQQFVYQQMVEIASDAVTVIEEIADQLDEYKYSLIGNTGSAELYFLPIRISKLIGWAGFSLSVLTSPPPASVINILDHILQTYPLSCAAISEQQAPFLVIGAKAFFTTTAHDKLETILGLMFNDLTSHRGVLADSRLPPSEVIEFLLRRREAKFDGWRWLANPSSLSFAILLCGALYGLSDEFDVGLEDLDHCAIGAFVPLSYGSFFEARIEEGANLIFRVGHDFWRMDELTQHWNSTQHPSSSNEGESLLAALCSMLFPDRVPWLLLNPSKPS